MPYVRLSLTICVCAVALIACGDDGPKRLREATKADLQQLLLAEDDVGGSYSIVRDGIEGVVEPCLSDDQICQVVLKPNEPAGGTICAYAEVQRFKSVESAREGFETVRDGYAEGALDPEVGIEVLHPAGLVNNAVAGYWQDDDPLCSPASEPAHLYGVIFQRSNLLTSVRVWSTGEQGLGEAVSLARKQAARIEKILADD